MSLLLWAALSLGQLAAKDEAAASEQRYCQTARITGYVKSEYGPRTYDGTSIWTDEPIAAASWDIPIDSTVWIEDLGTFRIADRGMLGAAGWIDVAVDSRDEAYSITGTRLICVTQP